MAKDIQNVDVIARKLRPTSTKAINHRLEVAKKEQRNREKLMERQKTEAMAAKCRRDGEKISLSNRKEENYESDNKDDIDQD